MTFTANLSGGNQEGITFNWSVSAGSIVEGQGTPSIRVSVPSDGSVTNVTATVNIGGTQPACNCDTEASETAGVAPTIRERTEVDDFGNIANDDVRQRLDAFFATLQSDPTAQGYIINYGTPRNVTRRETLIRNHITFRGFDASRITFVNGGDNAEGIRTRLVLVPAGAEAPTP
jgi:hypothetical protein